MHLKKEAKKKVMQALGLSQTDYQRIKSKWTRNRGKIAQRLNLKPEEMKILDALTND